MLRLLHRSQLVYERTRVPGGKGASLFFMIPLERWNVERKSLSAGKREVPLVGPTSSLTPNRLVEVGTKCYVPPTLKKSGTSGKW